uniref:nck-associated protein 5-like isoform X2 n=1 Tax=Doryrhamphus excisus TaxID=161450 RepID=UPI0025ADF607|nr:nck-associated protein 5-like isoform X2 [Doryrhamphus excisus]
MRTMSDETQQRMCDEDFGSDEEGEEADVESYLEDNSSELMDRLKELEAENSALMLANESQREAYERCLDEVANHVVQALLNQKDLREECIKLKMLVFDLERQNRALCELFQQKLPNHSTAHYQVQAGPLPDYNAQLHNDPAKHLEAAQTEAQAKGNGYPTQHSSPGPRGPAASSMEALSPFFKKKAHILEVLRKMEETDPLKFHPATSSLSFCDYSQVLMSTEAVLASTDPLQSKSHRTHCHCSQSDADALQHVNGDTAAKCEGGNGCCLHCKRSPDAPLKPCAHPCAPPGAVQSHGAPGAAMNECHSKRRTAESVSVVPSKNDTQQLPAVADGNPNRSREEVEQKETSEELTDFFPVPHVSSSEAAPVPVPDRESSEVPLSSTGGKDAAPEKEEADPEAPDVRAGASVSPSPSCLSDVKAAAINSPSKLLKLLKIPSIGEKCQGSSPAVRLSPQLTRSSRIPCRTNNYEVYHSPVPTRRATTTERCRQPPPPPTRSESYPATHSAPTSPPQSQDASSTPPAKVDDTYSSFSAPKPGAPSKMAAPSSVSSPKASQSIPHYENIGDLSTSARDQESTHAQEKRTTLPSQPKTNVGERKLVKSLPESVLTTFPQRKQSSSSSFELTSDDEDDEDSLVWVNHHGLPDSLPLANANLSSSQTREEVAVENCEVAKTPPPPPPTRRSDSSSIPKRPAPGPTRSQADSSHYAFKDRLAALGKLRSSEDLQAGFKPVDASNEAAEEKSKTSERPVELLKEEQRHSKYTDSLDGKPRGPGGGLKYPGSSQLHDQGVKSPSSGVCVGKTECSKSRIGLASPNADAPQVLRNNIKCPGSLNLAYNLKSGNSPNKIPPKSPSKPCQGPSVHRAGKPPDAPRYSSKSEERTKISGKGKKNPMYGDSLPPPPPRPPASESEKPQPPQPPPPVPSPQSAIEQKVMKGIEENMLKLQEQDRGLIQGGEVKQKASNGIASWFGRKKSKLPALSRKADAPKAKDEKREWKINIPSVGKDSVKMASRCKEGVEGLNISTLMEKAEGLRRALEEERAYVERSGRGHSCEVVMDQAQGQLAVMYRGGRSDNFMQQLLNRVDGKDPVSIPQRRLSFDCKTSRPLFGQHGDIIAQTGGGDDIEKQSDRLGKITSDENLTDSVHSQHFAGSGASTYTLDSGIGTFPLPDCSSGAAGRGLSKTRAEHHPSASPGRAGRRARTLDREPTPQEEFYTPHKQPIPTVQHGSKMEGRSPAGLVREDLDLPQFEDSSRTSRGVPGRGGGAGGGGILQHAVPSELESWWSVLQPHGRPGQLARPGPVGNEPQGQDSHSQRS